MKVLKNLIYVIVAITAFCAVEGRAQSIFANTITGTNPNTANPYTTGQVVDPNLTASGIGRGAGINGNNGTDRYNANGFDNTDLAASITDGAFFTFTLTPNTGASINFSSIAFTLQTSGTGPTGYALLSSIGGFTAGNDIATAPTVNGAFTISDATLGAAYDNVTSADEFRLYGYGASAAAGTGSVNDFAFNGDVTVPEPGTYGMVFGGMAVLVGLQRRQGRGRATVFTRR